MSKATLERIELAISELNYRPSSVARQLKTGQAPVLGLLVPSILNPMLAELARAVEAVAKKEYGYRILLGNTDRQTAEEEIFLNDLLAHGVRGVIVVSSVAEQDHFRDAIRKGMVMIHYDQRALDGGEARLEADNVSMNNHEAGRLAAHCLIDAGCRLLAFATASGQTVSRSDKIRGFLDAVAEAGLPDAPQVIEGQARREYGDSEMSELGIELASRIAAMDPRPEGVVAINDMMAIGLLAGFRKCGVKVPDDISLVGIDDVYLSALVSPAITSVRSPVREMAAQMVKRLVARLADPSLPVGDFLFLPQLVSRESVGTRSRS